ncbi:MULTISPECIES: GNAT family N-acetyltransferase [Helcococcus]|uniref:GNAT family N-acetyltransferase n=1 Tax=Helcococcus bovis TaxID=3153252 RepID=A0ABW9F530_9FIRM
MIKIVFEKENKRSAAYDRDKLVGVCTYNELNGEWMVNHTGVEKEYGGQGIASKLVECLVENARKERAKIHPICSFVKREFDKNEEYRDLLA